MPTPLPIRRTAAWLVLLTLLAGGVLWPGLAAPGDVLASIDKAALSRLAPGDITALRSILELRRSWLIVGPSDVLDRLARDGAGLMVIDRAPAGRWYELTVGAGGGERGRVAPAGGEGRAAAAAGVRVEEGVWVTVAADQAAGASTPPGSRTIRVSSASTTALSVAAARAIRRVPLAVAGVREDPRVADLVAEVSAERLRAGVEALESFQTRDATTSAALAAANFLYDSFRRLGLDTRYEDFTFTGTIDGVRTAGLPATNVVATIPGRVSPDQIVVVGAHYDSFGREQTRTFAPGADDNASGSAALMEIGRVLSRQPCDFTVRIVAFGAEEYGLHGSRQHATAARAAGERIIAVLNLDMIGYTDRVPEDLDLVVNTESEWLASRFAAAASRYAPLPIAQRLDPLQRSSDHAPFWDSGYTALLGIEDAVLNNPYYHRATDTVETLNFDFATAVTRATLAATADLAQPTRAPAPPSRPGAEATVLRSLVSRVKLTTVSWSAPSDGRAVAYHVYRSTTSRLGYERITGAPVAETFFHDRTTVGADRPGYYVVTAVDAEGRESNYSVEVNDGRVNR